MIPPNDARGSRHGERVFRVQQAFVDLRRQGPGPFRPADIAKASGLDDSTVGRILQSGIYTGHFERPLRGRYDLGSAAADLGFAALSNNDSLSGHEAKELLHTLRHATNEGLVFLYLKAPFGIAGRQCLDMSVGDSDLKELGMTPRDVLSVTRSLRTGASGRTILAYLSEDIQQRVAAEPIPAEAGPGVLRDPQEFLDSLAEIRDVGYGLGQQECMKAWNSCAAPIIHRNTVMGAVLLLKPCDVMPKARASVIAATVKAGSDLSSLGGWTTEP
ncbi:IclR family transcriptional regulator C-terminal domain-containing protein [Streptomyces sp. NPDC007088]|uniref:IclR family transcriptional regulator domain-containing protein n=1 Tax=Streptomyces sp. NPDC007088 TaxID=3364773 RepID=UPI0036C79D88